MMSNKERWPGSAAYLMVSIMLLAILSLTACGVLGTNQPAEVTATEPVASPTQISSYLDTLEHVPDPDLIDKTWVWVSKEPNGNQTPAIEVTDPENYTIVFNADGTFSTVMDCNSGTGEYASHRLEFPQHGIYMEMAPMTLADCGEGSLSTEMSYMFGPAQDYEYAEDGQVVRFLLVAAGPIYVFRDSSTQLP